MAFFSTQYIDSLYVAAYGPGDRGFIAFVVPAGIDTKGAPIELKEALSSTFYSGTFVFAATPPVIGNAADATAFVGSIYKVLQSSGASRAFIWLQNNTGINADTAPLMGVDGDGTTVNSGLQAMLTNTLSLTVSNGIALSWQDATTLLLNGAQNNFQIGFGGPSAPVATSTFVATMAFSGPLRGTFQFAMGIQRQSLYTNMRWGFQVLFPTPDGAGPALYGWLPLAVPDPGSTDYIGFTINIDPTDVTNTAFDPCNTGPCTISGSYGSRRTWFDFTGRNVDNVPTELASFYRTAFGAPVTLAPDINGVDALPARLVFCLAQNATTGSTSIASFLLTPEGDFTIQVPSARDGSRQFLLGGLQGTEFFDIMPQTASYPGDKLRFLSGRPAYAPQFPFREASPVKAPQVPDAPLLTGTFTTAWATLLSGGPGAINYVAQPKGSALFGSNALITTQYTDLFGHNTPGFTFRADDMVTFPLLPYSGVLAGDGINSFSGEQLLNFENQVVSPSRRKYIGLLSTARSLLRGDRTLTDSDVPQTSTTPSGLLAAITSASTGQIQWNNVLLGQNTDEGTDYLLQFINPDDRLVEALQTGDLMLVSANADHLGHMNGALPGEPAFLNKMGIGGWEMTAAVGRQNKYNDYRDVMIIKGKKGKLYDPANTSASLVANPSKWTQKEDFAAPTVTDARGTLLPPDKDQLVILSQWLQTYFAQAAAQGDNTYFAKFNTIAREENWTGILLLRVNISKLPDNLAGIMAGVTDPDAFNAHHLAVEISPIRKQGKDAVLDKPSSIFGLIYYVDPSFDDNGPQTSIIPTGNDPYDFRLLTLKVLFENTAVRSFESLAQLTVTELLGMPVTKMGDPANIYFNVLLKGSLQINNDRTLYSLLSQGDNTFYFDNTVIHKIQIPGVLLSTLHTDATGILSWFGMSGFIDYYVLGPASLPPNPPGTFDIFSFGNETGEDYANKGLKFNNLGISMSFPVADPTNKTMLEDASQITFDTSHSTPRPNSLYLNFALDMQELVIAEKGIALTSKGYLQVIPDIPMTDVSSGSWYGLRLKLNMGSPGELAGKINLDSYMLLAWSPDSNEAGYYKASIGIALPGTGGGAKLISLQNVIKLSIGQIRLSYDASQSSFLLMLTEIALKFLGLLKVPPNGSTLFYLFGNPDAGGKASGLGWYAMYRQTPPAKTAVALSE